MEGDRRDGEGEKGRKETGGEGKRERGRKGKKKGIHESKGTQE